ncbi:zinc finger, CCHC-type containing protein [Tanacetum coccineum]
MTLPPLHEVGIFTIELFAFPNKSWVYDTGCGTHICITKQGFREARKLKQGALYLYVGNGVRAQVEAIGSFDLVLPNGLVICLDNCHYAPSITRGVVSVHHLVENGFVQCFTDFGILVSKNNVHYFMFFQYVNLRIDMHDLVPNNNSIYNVSTKRAKRNLDSTYLWHCRLAHISKKRIEKLQQEGLLRSTDDESFDQCVSCLFFGQMTRNHFHNVLKGDCSFLELIHTDVCGHLDMVKTRVKGCEALVKLDTPDKLNKDSNPMEVEGFEPPQEEVISDCRSERTHRAPERLCLNVEAEEHSLGDLNKPTSYKAAMLDSESDKWINAMNVEMQSMIDNMVWVLVDLPLIVRTVGDYLGKCFAMKDLGEAAFILGIKIYRDRSKRLIGLSQSAYMDKILKRYRMDNSKRGHIPMQERLDLNKTQGALTPEEVRRVKTDRDDTKIQTGEYVFILNKRRSRLKSSKQSTTAMFTTEVEYIAASEVAVEAIWIRKFISGLGIIPTINKPIKMFCDNSVALHFANELGVQKGARHYHRRYHYDHESIEQGKIKFLKVYTDDNLDDPFTKALSK